MLAPLWYPIARDAPGGIETFLYQLVGALSELGCEITLVAGGDSDAPARLVPAVERNLYDLMLERAAGEYVYYEQHQLSLAVEMAPEYDLVHSHLGPGGFVLSSLPGVPPVLHTIHTPVYADMKWFAGKHPHMAVAAVSDFQAAKLRQAGIERCWVVPNGIDLGAFTFNDHPGDGLLFVGRMEQGKGPDLAIEVARALGRPLTLAGPITDGRFFKERIEPSLGDEITYAGVVGHSAKNNLMGEAACMLLPFRHAESFGMVSLEAMACGTPVVALANGALPEVIEDGVTGYLATGTEGDSLQALVEALSDLTKKAVLLDRPTIRERVASRFSINRSAEQYVELYRLLIDG
jgi:glycosyltransferase involved in cell wall biosynthesis